MQSLSSTEIETWLQSLSITELETWLHCIPLVSLVFCQYPYRIICSLLTPCVPVLTTLIAVLSEHELVSSLSALWALPYANGLFLHAVFWPCDCGCPFVLAIRHPPSPPLSSFTIDINSTGGGSIRNSPDKQYVSGPLLSTVYEPSSNISSPDLVAQYWGLMSSWAITEFFIQHGLLRFSLAIICGFSPTRRFFPIVSLWFLYLHVSFATMVLLYLCWLPFWSLTLLTHLIFNNRLHNSYSLWSMLYRVNPVLVGGTVTAIQYLCTYYLPDNTVYPSWWSVAAIRSFPSSFSTWTRLSSSSPWSLCIARSQ